MLKSLLSKEDCAKCCFCCSFRRKSLWETPVVSDEFTKKYEKDLNGRNVNYRKYVFDDETCTLKDIGAESGRNEEMICAQTDLRDRYVTANPEEEVKCPFLNEVTGCMLPEEDKPFDCKIWPLRYMKMKDGSLKICLTPTCEVINKVPRRALEKLIDEGLGKKIREYAKTHPFMIKPYVEGFIILS